ncbi:MAG: DUF1656 domain-containing protein [Rhizobiaceae bacterium]|nr:DUF1656 domain-containing protein [Rhizobiaceae bacterium]
MTQQIDIYGVFIPTLIVLALSALVISRLLGRGLARIGFYRFVWHRPLFELATYVSTLGVLVLLCQRYQL